MSVESKPILVSVEVKEIRRFIDEEIDTIGCDVLRRTIHRMLDRVNVADLKEASEHASRIEKQGGVMADTARRNVRLEKENAELRACLEYFLGFVASFAEPMGADCETTDYCERARAVLEGSKNGKE